MNLSLPEVHTFNKVSSGTEYKSVSDAYGVLNAAKENPAGAILGPDHVKSLLDDLPAAVDKRTLAAYKDGYTAGVLKGETDEKGKRPNMVGWVSLAVVLTGAATAATVWYIMHRQEKKLAAKQNAVSAQ